MPYLLSSLEDGKPPAWASVPPGTVAASDEKLMDDAPPPDAVWDAASGQTRPKTEAESLEPLKKQKVDEMASVGIAELSALFTEGQGRDELSLLLAGHIQAICGALNIPADPRIGEVVAIGQKALARKQEVETVTDAAGLESITW